MNFENVLDTLYEFFKDMTIDQLENEMRETSNLTEIDGARVLMKNRVIVALINTKRRLGVLE